MIQSDILNNELKSSSDNSICVPLEDLYDYFKNLSLGSEEISTDNDLAVTKPTY